MRMRIGIGLTVCLGIATLGIAGGSAGASAPAKQKPPVTLASPVTNKGTKSAKNNAITVSADDYFFSPTFIKAKKGSAVKVTVKNVGSVPHTFTADDGTFDQQISPGDQVTVDVTVPSSGKPLAFHCDFHGSMGMKGAFFSKAGSAAKTTSSTGMRSGGYGY